MDGCTGAARRPHSLGVVAPFSKFGSQLGSKKGGTRRGCPFGENVVHKILGGSIAKSLVMPTAVAKNHSPVSAVKSMAFGATRSPKRPVRCLTSIFTGWSGVIIKSISLDLQVFSGVISAYVFLSLHRSGMDWRRTCQARRGGIT